MGRFGGGTGGAVVCAAAVRATTTAASAHQRDATGPARRTSTLLQHVVDVGLLGYAAAVHFALRLDLGWELVPPDLASDALVGFDLGPFREQVADEARVI